MLHDMVDQRISIVGRLNDRPFAREAWGVSSVRGQHREPRVWSSGGSRALFISPESYNDRGSLRTQATPCMSSARDINVEQQKAEWKMKCTGL